MPKITVEIEWDNPDEKYWLNADNVAIALNAYCENTNFIVRDFPLTILGHPVEIDPSLSENSWYLK